MHHRNRTLQQIIAIFFCLLLPGLFRFLKLRKHIFQAHFLICFCLYRFFCIFFLCNFCFYFFRFCFFCFYFFCFCFISLILSEFFAYSEVLLHLLFLFRLT